MSVANRSHLQLSGHKFWIAFGLQTSRQFSWKITKILFPGRTQPCSHVDAIAGHWVPIKYT
jgi:hypothetical protein